MLDLKESHQVVSFEEHEPNEAPVELLVAFYFVLKLTTHMSVQLLFIHGQGQAFDYIGNI